MDVLQNVKKHFARFNYIYSNNSILSDTRIYLSKTITQKKFINYLTCYNSLKVLYSIFERTIYRSLLLSPGYTNITKA